MEIPFEIKEFDEQEGTFVAYGSTFGNEDLGGDVVVKGAFTKSLESNPASKVYMFYNHDSKEIIGEYTNITEDDKGLLIEGKLFVDNIQRAKETRFLMQKGLIKKFSIGYSVIKKTFSKGKRMLEELKLVEVSPVTFPMNTQAGLLTVKNTEPTMTIEELDDLKSLADVEDFLRNPKELSKDGAKKFVSIITELKKVSGESESHTDGLTEDEREAQAKEEQEQKEAAEAREQKEQDEKALEALQSTLETLNEIKG